MITLPGQLAIKTIHGRNGDFNVGRLTTTISEFVMKNPELEQYAEGKYDGDFIITEIRPSTYNTSGRMVIEIRAHLGGMTLSSSERLTTDEASQLSPVEVDPLDEEAVIAKPIQVSPSTVAETPSSKPDPLLVTTPFGMPTPASLASEVESDAALFGALWPLGDVVKLDATVDRRMLRQQIGRLTTLGYRFNELSQEWCRIRH